MKILVLGSGGREHALVWKLRQSPRVERVWCAPGNGGIAQHAECVAAVGNDVAALADLAAKLGADLTVVGPEAPLVAGVVDEFERRALRILGPTRAAAQLEGSKIFAKRFMGRHGIPTAPLYGIYETPGDAYSALCAVDWPVVIKADGLCAGKGVLVAPGPDDATAFIDRLMEQREFGPAGDRILLEEALEGQELSYIVLTDGTSILPMAPTRDHKRAFDGDQGPNTGGMGAFSAPDLLPETLERTILETVVQPAIRGLAAEGIPYRGFLYFGLMLTRQGPKVLEFNCRMGDPETQPIVARMDFDLAEAVLAAAEGKLKGISPKWKPEASVCVVLASRGYPGSYETGKQIRGLDKLSPGVVAFHAGTRVDGSNYYTAGGRVLGVTGTGATLQEARTVIYDNISNISFDGLHFRRDIGLPRSESSAVAG